MRSRKNFERKLQKELEAAGHMVVRVAGSGVSSTAHCDLIMFPKDINLPCLIEVKTTSKDKWVFNWQTEKTKSEIKGLQAQAKQYGVRGVVALKFMRRPWIFLNAEKIDSNFRIEKENSNGDFSFL
jgi:Holliday junction resolvase